MSKISNLIRQRSAALIMLVLSSLAIFTFVIASTKLIVITDRGASTFVHTLRSDASGIIDDAGIRLTKYDTYNAAIDGPVGKIEIERAYPVILKCDGQEKTVMTTGGSVEAFLETQGVSLGTYDLINHSLAEITGTNMSVVVQRVRYELVNVNTPIPYGTTSVASKLVPRGRSLVESAGKNGTAFALKQNMYVDGKLASGKILEQHVLSKPVNEVVAYGTGGEELSSRGEVFRYSYYFDAKATAYTCGEPGVNNITATGKQVRVGTVAVDPKVIPLGTRLYIEYPNGNWAYGFAVAEDTGGAIKGKRVDLYFNTLQEANQFGVHKVRVYVLD